MLNFKNSMQLKYSDMDRQRIKSVLKELNMINFIILMIWLEKFEKNIKEFTSNNIGYIFIYSKIILIFIE